MHGTRGTYDVGQVLSLASIEVCARCARALVSRYFEERHRLVALPFQGQSDGLVRLTGSRCRAQSWPLAIVEDAWDHQDGPGWGSATWIGPTR
jgi:hypothetical protein